GGAVDAVEDVVQETLLEAWKHQERLHTPQGLDYWLDEICRNICRRYARTATRDQRHLTPLVTTHSPDDDLAAHQTPHDLADARIPDPLDVLERNDMALLLDRALGTLPVAAREIIALC